MLDPESMQIFNVVARTGSFSEAARQLNLATSSVSRHVSVLEEALGSRLLNRTTRSMTLTESGLLFQQHSNRILTDLQELQSLVMDQNQTPTGTLRLSVPQLLGRLYIGPAVIQYMKQWPEVSIELELTDRVTDLVESGVDIGVRVGQLPDSSLIARRLAPLRRLVCASPEYIDRHGRPESPQELVDHNCIGFHSTELSMHSRANSIRWQFDGNAGSERISVAGNLAVNSADVLVQAAVAGCGLIMVADWIAKPQLEDGSLVPVLSEYEAAPSVRGEMGIYAVYPSSRHAPAKVHSFIEHLIQSFRQQRIG